MKRNILLKTIYILVLCLALSGVAFTSSVDVYEGYYKSIFEFVEMVYFRDMDADGLAGTALNGAMEGMDEYSCFVLNDSGTVSGAPAGLFLEKVRDGLRVVSVLPDSSAAESGIMSGDTIILLDKMSTAVMSEDAFNSYIQTKGSSLVNYIEGNTGITRAAVIESGTKSGRDVEFVYLGGDVGYIRINRFSEFTTERVKGILGAMDELGNDRIILDLRNLYTMNIEGASAVADMLMPGGFIARTRRQTYNASYKKTEYDLAIIVNENTAGAAEAIAMALPGTVYGNDTMGYAVYTAGYPVLTAEAYEKYAEETGYPEISRMLNYLKSRGTELSDDEVSGYVNIVESGIYGANGRLIDSNNRVKPGVYVEDTEMGYLNYSPGAFEIDIARDYREGAMNYDVYIAKKILGFMGYFEGEYDVVFGDDMKDAVNRYKQAMGFPGDGILDMDTQSSLNTYSMKTAVFDDPCVQEAHTDFID